MANVPQLANLRDAQAAKRESGFFGHPWGLAYIAFTEVWERFSFYGMQALLTLYMVNHLLEPDVIEQVRGFETFRTVMESVTGPLPRIALASQIFGIYTGLVYLSPLIGGWIGDQLIGRTRAVLAGGIFMAAGHIAMAFETLFLLALLLLIIGVGLLKGNLVVQIGELYGKGDPRRTTGFGLYLLSINIGAFAAPLVCGTLGELYGWHYGFGAAAVGMGLGILIYLSGLRWLPPDRPTGASAAKADRPPATGADRRAIVAILLTFLPFLLYMAAAGQAYNLFLVWVSGAVDRSAGGFLIPVTWFLTLDALMTMAGVMLAIRFWRWQAKRGKVQSDFGKFGIACCMGTTAYLTLAAATHIFGDGPVPLFVPACFFILLSSSYAFVDPPLKALTTRYAPAGIVTTMIGLQMAVYGVANLVVGWLGRFYEQIGAAQFWLLHAAIAASAGLCVLLSKGLVARLLGSTGSQDSSVAR